MGYGADRASAMKTAKVDQQMSALPALRSETVAGVAGGRLAGRQDVVCMAHGHASPACSRHSEATRGNSRKQVGPVIGTHHHHHHLFLFSGGGVVKP